MLSNIYLLHFNNYYNRIIKRYETLDEYLALDDGNVDEDGNKRPEVVLGHFDKVNFIPNDGVDTSQVVNWNGTHPDYLLVTESVEDGVDDEGHKTYREDIVSRWFVVHQKRTTHGQLELTLHRDVVADYYDEAMNTTCFVEKGNVSKINDPAIYNSEDMSFNQIKKNQTKLFDKTGCPWVVGYIPRDAFSYEVNTDEEGAQTVKEKKTESTVTQTFPIPLKKDIIALNGIEKWPLYKYLNQNNIYTENKIKRYEPHGIQVKDVLGRRPASIFGGYYTFYGGATVSIGGVCTETTKRDSSKWSDPVKEGETFLSTLPASGYTTGLTALRGLTIKDTSGANVGPLTGPGYNTNDQFAGTWLTAYWYNWYTGGVTYPAADQSTKPIINNTTTAKKLQDDLYTAIANCTQQGISTNDYRELLQLNGLTLYDQLTSRYYKINVRSVNNGVSVVSSSDYNTLVRNQKNTSTAYPPEGKNYITCKSIYTGGAGLYEGISEVLISDVFFNWNDNKEVYDVIKPVANDYDIYFSLTALSSKLSVDIPSSFMQVEADSRLHLQDSPYDMFCLPYEDGIRFKSGTNTIVDRSSKLSALCIAQGIPIDPQAGSGTIYDIQLLPYCPVANYIGYNTDGSLDLSQVKYNLVTAKGINGENLGAQSVLIWCDTASFSVELPYSIPKEDDVLKKKLKNLTDVYRLSSPNWSGGFDFNPMKNNGVESFSANCTYKPYNPYIHVEPKFNPTGLYGGDYQDARGLVCGGDFSTAQVTSAWADYQMNNKTYQLQFDREISHMETMNKIDRDEQAVNAALGTLSGGAQGAAAGAAAGPVGAIVGGVVGTLTSAAGAIADAEFLKQRQQENLSYTKDMYGFNMQNIQMVPQGLAKVAADNANNTLVPVLEYYSCDDIEKIALLNKLKYNGMTIMRIGKLDDFTAAVDYENLDFDDVGPQDRVYVKGKLIRLENLKEDFHVAMALKEEINMGVFI